MEVTKHEPGMFSWADLASTDEKGSRRFYTELLGLNATAFPMGGAPSTCAEQGRQERLRDV